MKAYITKYALTDGIRVVDGTIVATDMFTFEDKGHTIYAYGDEYQLTWEEALERAEEMRTKRMESLRKQIERLEALTFSEPNGKAT